LLRKEVPPRFLFIIRKNWTGDKIIFGGRVRPKYRPSFYTGLGGVIGNTQFSKISQKSYLGGLLIFDQYFDFGGQTYVAI